MSMLLIILLFCSGVVGGIVNALAGGATLITFPVMLAAGLPPVVANASNAVAVSPGHLVAAISERRQLPPFGRPLVLQTVTSVIGGGFGALLLFATPDRLFTLFVPMLVAVATFVFAFGQQFRAWQPTLSSTGIRQLLLGLVSVYGGYFGAGLGVMLLAILTITGAEDQRAANILKNLLAAAVGLVTIVVFVITGIVAWPPTLLVLVGAVAGGHAGAKLANILPRKVVRIAVIAIGTLMSFAYAWRYWW